MDIEVLKLIFDFGLLVLIWLVQLVIYPGFSYYQKHDLLRWHKKYTIRLGYVVMPLMIGQLSLAIVQVINDFTMLSTVSLGLIIGVWLSTFLQFVPLHRKISSNVFDNAILKQLVQRNWLRTVLWTLIFVLSCLGMI